LHERASVRGDVLQRDVSGTAPDRADLAGERRGAQGRAPAVGPLAEPDLVSLRGPRDTRASPARCEHARFPPGIEHDDLARPWKQGPAEAEPVLEECDRAVSRREDR